MTLKQLSQEFMVHNLTIIQHSDLMGGYFLQFILLFTVTEQVIHIVNLVSGFLGKIHTEMPT